MSCTPSGYRFCPCCGGPLERQRRNAGERLRYRLCRQVLYVNPAVGVAVVIRRGEEIFWGAPLAFPTDALVLEELIAGKALMIPESLNL